MADDEEEKRAARFEPLIQTTKTLTISGGSKQDEELTLVLPPVLRYSDAVSSDALPAIPDGAVFVWTRKGQPEAVTSMHLTPTGNIWAEFLSLSPHPLIAERKAQTIWSPNKSAAEYLPISSAPAPSKTAAFRLTQMRSILKSFSASISDQSAGRQELRLLPQPIFRFSQQEKGIIDGAIFAFVRSTNPEMLVILEARTDKEKEQWVYSSIRYSGRQCEMRCADERVWSHEQKFHNDAAGSFYTTRIQIKPEVPN